jgi:hypothetical protein
MNRKQKVNDKCLCGSGKKYKKCCINKIPSNDILKKIIDIEKEEIPLLIEGTLRNQQNIINAKMKYGNIFNGKIVSTKYFGNEMEIPTLVCSEDNNLVLGKPRYPEKFTDDEYKIKLIDRYNCGKYSIEVTKIEDIPKHTYISPQTLRESITRNTLDELNKNIKELHCKICGDTEKEGKIMKIPTQIGDIYLCEFCYNIQINM